MAAIVKFNEAFAERNDVYNVHCTELLYIIVTATQPYIYTVPFEYDFVSKW